MGVVINVIESKFYNQFYNGVDFTDRLSESTNNKTLLTLGLLMPQLGLLVEQ